MHVSEFKFILSSFSSIQKYSIISIIIQCTCLCMIIINILTITSIITSLLFRRVVRSFNCLIYSFRTSMTVDLILEISMVANFVNYYYLLFLIHHTVSLTSDRPSSVVNAVLVSGDYVNINISLFICFQRYTFILRHSFFF